jgi:hypothetical protein
MIDMQAIRDEEIKKLSMKPISQMRAQRHRKRVMVQEQRDPEEPLMLVGGQGCAGKRISAYARPCGLLSAWRRSAGLTMTKPYTPGNPCREVVLLCAACP